MEQHVDEAVMQIVLAIGFGLAVVCWGVSAASFFLAAKHRKPELSWTDLAFNGIKFFDADNFTDVGKQHQKRGLKAMLSFFVCVVAAFVLAIATQQT